jgi:predicted N-acetyltransferase YhbS
MVELAQRPMRIVRERRGDGPAIEAMIATAFGPDRMQKTVYKLREGVRPIRELCFVARDQSDKLVASLRFWPILINERWPAVLLGPLAVAPELRGLGYGKALMWQGLARCRELGISRVILVGDPEYYNPFGFRRDLALNLQLPGWVEERRFLALETIAGAMVGVHGMIGKAVSPPRPRAEPKKVPAPKRDRARDQARKARAKGKLRKRRTLKRRK